MLRVLWRGGDLSYERGTLVGLERRPHDFPHVPTRGLVGLALKVQLAQARGTLSMGREVYARRA